MPAGSDFLYWWYSLLLWLKNLIIFFIIKGSRNLSPIIGHTHSFSPFPTWSARGFIKETWKEYSASVSWCPSPLIECNNILVHASLRDGSVRLKSRVKVMCFCSSFSLLAWDLARPQNATYQGHKGRNQTGAEPTSWRDHKKDENFYYLLRPTKAIPLFTSHAIDQFSAEISMRTALDLRLLWRGRGRLLWR